MTSPAVPSRRALLPTSFRTDPPSFDGAGSPRRSTRDWAVDLALFLAAASMAVASVLSRLGGTSAPIPLAADAVVGGVCCLGVWVRRRWPAAFAIITCALTSVAVVASGAALIALFTVTVHRRAAISAPIAAGYTAVALLGLVIRPASASPVWTVVALAVTVPAGVLAWGMFVRARRSLLMSLHERALRAESEQELRVERARQLERNRIAREMHDVLAHRLSLLSLHAGALELRPDAPPADVARAAAVIRDSAHQALEDLREVVGVLRADPAVGGEPEDAPDRPQPALSDVGGLVRESQRAGMRVALDCRIADLAVVPAAIGRSAYRIVQEGLTNARKHACDAPVSVTVHGSAGDGLTVEVRNAAPAGARPAWIPGAGAGIIGLAERASLAGGRLEHGRTPAGGFRLWAWLPWPT